MHPIHPGDHTEAEAAVQELSRPHQGAAKYVFEPGETLHRQVSLSCASTRNPNPEATHRIGNRNSEQNQQVRHRLALTLGRRELGVKPIENDLVRLWVVDLMPRAFNPGVYAQKSHPCSETGEDVQ